VNRLGFLDATRGVGMLAVFIAHFGLFYLGLNGADALAVLAYQIGLFAAPAFVGVSGVMLGMLRAQQPEAFEGLRPKLVDRALFLLTVGHLLILAAHLPTIRHGTPIWFFITDVLGVSIVLGCTLFHRLSATVRALLALVLFFGSIALNELWIPSSDVAGFVKALFVGRTPGELREVVFPLVPWLGVYLAGTVVGDHAARWTASPGRLARNLMGLGLSAAVLGLVLRPLLLLLARALGQELKEGVTRVTSPMHSLPPSPAYVLFVGGLTLILLGAFAALEPRVRGWRSFRVLTGMGQNSLVLFIVQYFVYYVGFFYLRLPYSPLWPLILAASIGLIWVISTAWQARGWNKYLTVGLKALRRPSEARSPD
jgi:uncharacterized membrane protein